MTAICKITDGTPANTVNMVSPGRGLHICEWTQSPQEIQYQTIMTGSGKEIPVNVLIGNGEQQITYRITGENQDDVIDFWRKLRAIGMRATRVLRPGGVQAFGANVESPVYIQIKASRESNTAYAPVYAIETPGFNWVGMGFLDTSPFTDEMSVVIRHGDWSNVPPGQTYAVPVQTTTYMAGNWTSPPASTAVNMAVVGNRECTSEPYWAFLSTTGAIDNTTSNENDGPYPIVLMENGKYLMICTRLNIDDDVTGTRSLANLQFSLSQQGSGTYSLVWEYWNDSSWQPLPDVVDETENLQQSGGVYFRIPHDWYAPYWIRCRKSSGIILNRPFGAYSIHSANHNYLHIPAQGGDLDTLWQIEMSNPSTPETEDPTNPRIINELMMGVKSAGRGGGFFRSMVVPDDDNFTEASGTGLTSLSKQADTVGGYVANFVVPGIYIAGTIQRALALKFDANHIAAAYSGTYRCLLSLSLGTIGADDISRGTFQWRAVVLEGKDWYGDKLQVYDTSDWASDFITSPPTVTLLDVGNITLPMHNASGGKGDFYLGVDTLLTGTWSEATNRNVWIHAIILIPADESFVHITAPKYLYFVGDVRLKTRSAEQIGGVDAHLVDETSNDRVQTLLSAPDGQLTVPADDDAYIHMLAIRKSRTIEDDQPIMQHEIETAMRIYEVRAAKRYLGSRGTG